MTNIFLEVNKDLFKLGLNPAEILLLAQVMEYERNTGDFFTASLMICDIGTSFLAASALIASFSASVSLNVMLEVFILTTSVYM